MSTAALQRRVLLMLSPVTVTDPAADPLPLPRKFLDGVCAFAELWRGQLLLLLPQAAQRDDNLDYVSIPRAGLPFEACPLPDSPAGLLSFIQSSAVTFVPLVPQYTSLHPLCTTAGVPLVLYADRSLKTRREIVRAETRNPLVRWRRLLWLERMEVQYRAMLRAASGAQLQDAETYDAYAPLNRSPLLYHDTRMRRAMFATDAQRNARRVRLQSGTPLRLVYSGKWIARKGVLDLPRVALELQRLGVPFEMDIYGGGVLETKLRRALTDAGLNHVRLRGELPFPELMRRVADECDLFICCHTQGDPAATFIEMLSVGIPLVGYDTGALRGIVSLSGAGWLTPRENPSALAARIAQLDQNRAALVAATDSAAAFTQNKSFEDVMQQRTAHLVAVAEKFTPTLAREVTSP